MKSENQKIKTLLLSISLINLSVCLITQAFFSYGIFRDELYYIASTNHLDFGFVDHPPLSIFILAAWKLLFGDSVFVIRIVPAIISSLTIFILGLFTNKLGGNKTAVIISTTTFMFSAIFLGMNTIYSMNTFDFLFWILSAYIYLRLIQTENKKIWLLLGIILGFGLLNKTSLLWLGAGIFIGTIFTPLRKDLKTKYPYLAALIALVIFSPYIIWNITHDFAHLEFMRNAATRKYGGLTPFTFIVDQILILNPLTVLIWLSGIIFFFFRNESKNVRALGFIWLTTFFILLINGHSKGEYMAASYQLLFAGGAVLIEKWSSFNKRSWIKYVITVPVIATEILLAPFARPLLSPENFLKYQSAMGLKPPSNEGHELVGLPQFYSDMFGWEDLAKNVSSVYSTLSDEQKHNTFVYCSNYGKAGAIEYYSKKYPLPKVICPHNSYWYWWPDIKSDATIIIIGGEIKDHLQALNEVKEVGFHHTEYAMPYENNLKIFIGRGLKISLQEIRQTDKAFI
ncbi:MAG TPA: glycosyltransferase family 39 protein [Ignavibacteriaceae bacterium]